LDIQTAVISMAVNRTAIAHRIVEQGETMKAKWPSLQEQLRSDNIIAGSALENIVRDNQHFDLLDPEEINDNRNLPPWLRVFWRRCHPEVQDLDFKRGGVYPQVLSTVYAQMLVDQEIPWKLPENAIKIPIKPKSSTGKHDATGSKRGAK
jgi:hypothetical protein